MQLFRLQKQTAQNEPLISDLRLARTMFARMRGLLGTRTLAQNEALWIQNCNSIHTFFMNYAIDCIFLDKKLRIKSLKKGVVPGRVVWPQWGASSVVELSEGQIEHLKLNIGDQLHVGT